MLELNGSLSWPPNEDIGFTCPRGGQFYICALSWTQFVGCCASDPCASGLGQCPDSDLRTTSYDGLASEALTQQTCTSDDSKAHWYSSINCGGGSEDPFVGCCSKNACDKGCSQADLVPAELGLNSSSYFGTLSVDGQQDPTSGWHEPKQIALPGAAAVLGLCLALTVVLTVLTSFLILRFFPKDHGNAWSYFGLRRKGIKVSKGYTSMPEPSTADDGQGEESHNSQGLKTPVESNATAAVFGDARVIRPRDWTWVLSILWKLGMTLLPILFMILATLAIRLEGSQPSLYGDAIRQATRVSPTVYPIVFAAVAGRFYKSLARWSLEGPKGSKLAILEQLSGSQSFAGALERLVFVRAHIIVGLVTLFTWSLSPLGGQGAFRMLYIGDSRSVSHGQVFFANPAEQFSLFTVESLASTVKTNVFAIYNLALMSTSDQRRAATDTWGFPKIPQWPQHDVVGNTRKISKGDLLKSEVDYNSLIGIKIQGLDLGVQDTTYDFTLETSHLSLDCSIAGRKVDSLLDGIDSLNGDTEALDGLYSEIATQLGNGDGRSFAAALLEQRNHKHNTTGASSPYNLIFVTQKNAGQNPTGFLQNSEQIYSLFECGMQSMVLQTSIRCPSASSCFPTKQRLVDQSKSVADHDHTFGKFTEGFRKGLKFWTEASGTVGQSTASATESFIAGESNMYTSARQDWADVDIKQFSRRLTTLFNTFWDATKGPLTYPSIVIGQNNVPKSSGTFSRPEDITDSYKSTDAVAWSSKVYRTDRVWLGILLGSAVVLQTLACLGALLLVFIKGPDVLGFASTMTRDNIHIPVPSGGSALDGAERARALKDLRLWVTDIRPEKEIGYIAITSKSFPPEQTANTVSAGEDLELREMDQPSTSQVGQYGEGQRDPGDPEEGLIQNDEKLGATGLHRRLDRKRLYE